MILFSEGFGSLGGVGDFDQRFHRTGAVSMSAAAGVFGSLGATWTTRTVAGDIQPVITVGGDVKYAGFWVNFSSGSGLNERVFSIGSYSRYINLSHNAIYERVTNTINQSRILTSVSGPTWLEFGNVGGRTNVYRNGLFVFATEGECNLANLRYQPGGTGGVLSFATCLLWNDVNNGDAFMNFPIGPKRIQSLKARATGDSTEWAASGGVPNWEAVTAPSWAGGAGVISDAAGQEDLYRFDALAWDPARVQMIQHRLSGFTESVTGRQVQGIIKTTDSTIYSDPISLPSVSPQIVIADTISQNMTKQQVDLFQFGMRSI